MANVHCLAFTLSSNFLNGHTTSTIVPISGIANIGYNVSIFSFLYLLTLWSVCYTPPPSCFPTLSSYILFTTTEIKSLKGEDIPPIEPRLNSTVAQPFGGADG